MRGWLKWLCIAWFFICFPWSFILCWSVDWTLGGAYTSYIGLIGGIFFLFVAILLLFNKLAIAKIFGFIGCAVNFMAYPIFCFKPHDVSFIIFLVILFLYSTITIIPFILLFNLKFISSAKKTGT